MLVGIFFLLAFIGFLYYHLYAKRKGFPNGPIPLPIVGNLLSLNPKDPIETFSAWAKTYGPMYTCWLGSDPNIVITDYEIMREALVKQGDVFAGRPQNLMNRLATKDGHGVVFSEGELWKDQRRFSLHVLRDFGLGKRSMEPKVMKEAMELVDFFHQKMNEGSETVLNPAWPIQVCVGNIINVLLLGYRFGSDDTKIRFITQEIAKNFAAGSSALGFALSNNPWLRHIPLFGHFGYDDIKKQMDLLHDFMIEEIENHKRDFDLDPETEAEDFTSVYLKELKKREESGDTGYFSQLQLAMTLLSLWVAGMETTVTTLKWGFLYMIHYPEVQQKCQKELDRVISGDTLSMRDQASTPYLKATINEIQRIGNIVPFNLQHTTTAGTVLCGHRIPKGTTVLPQISSVLRDPELFPEPMKFTPERFLENNGETLKKCDELIPFSMGKRQCLGESLARMELYLIFGTLLQKFQFLPKPGEEPELPTLEPNVGLALASKPYEVLIRKRDSVA